MHRRGIGARASLDVQTKYPIHFQPSVVQLPTTTTGHLIQVLIALNGTALNSLARTHGRSTGRAISPPSSARLTASSASSTHTATHYSIIPLTGTASAAIVRSSPVVIPPTAAHGTATAPDGTSSAITVRSSSGSVPARPGGAHSSHHVAEHGRHGEGEGRVHGVVLQTEAARRAGGLVAVCWREVAV